MDNLTILDQLYEPRNPNTLNLDRDDLIEYRVYQVDLEGNETYVLSTPDTFATVDASPNYVEYCYNVSAYWSTENYGELESRHSNNACTVPYAFGDVDFDSDTDINDVLSVVDFILEEDFPSEDEFRNADVNMDEEINIADVVVMVDIIFGGSARFTDYGLGELAYVDLNMNDTYSELSFEIEYLGLVRGLEFTLDYNPELTRINFPKLSVAQDGVIISQKVIEDGKMKIIAANLQSGAITSENNCFLEIPINFNGTGYETANITIDDIIIAGSSGELVEFITRTSQPNVKVVPDEFALLQNFPNPFNPSTEIRFSLPSNEYVNLNIYNMAGQKIKTLKAENMVAGYHSVFWNGINNVGNPVSAGMYFYSIQSNSFNKTKKMLFLK